MNLYKSSAPKNAAQSGTIIFYANNPREARQIASGHFQAPSGAHKTDAESVVEDYEIDRGEIESLKDGALGVGSYRILTVSEDNDEEAEEEEDYS